MSVTTFQPLSLSDIDALTRRAERERSLYLAAQVKSGSYGLVRMFRKIANLFAKPHHA